MKILIDVFKESGKWNYRSVYIPLAINIYNTDAILDYLYEKDKDLLDCDFIFRAKNRITKEINIRLVKNSKK